MSPRMAVYSLAQNIIFKMYPKYLSQHFEYVHETPCKKVLKNYWEIVRAFRYAPVKQYMTVYVKRLSIDLLSSKFGLKSVKLV